MAATGARTHAVLKVKARGRARIIVFDTQDLSVGRAPENDLSFDDPEMSRRHAVFRRSREGCTVEDMGTSNGTAVNGSTVERSALAHGDVVRIGEVEITYAETAKNPSSLGAPVEYASQLKSFGSPLGKQRADGDATILGLGPPVAGADDEDFEVLPAGNFDVDLQQMRASARAARDLDREMASLDADSDSLDDFDFAEAPAAVPAAPRPQPQPAGEPKVWELEELPDAPEPGRVALTLEIEGLAGELLRAVRGLEGKVLELPRLRVRIKGSD
jgi:predicted component of type VI protein secretion system